MAHYSKFGLLISLCLSFGMWFYVQHVMIGHQISEAKARETPRGNLSDLYPRWLGSEELFRHHRDPYSPEVTREIQIGYYGRPLNPARPNDPNDQQAFAYPLYVVFLLVPTIGLPFPVVQVVFLWLLVVATTASVLLWQRILHWHPSWATVIATVFLTLGSFQVLQGLKLQQLTLLVSVLIAISVACLVEGHLAVAGILLAITTIKPQVVVLVTSWLMLWALCDWARRKNFVLAFTATFSLLVVAAESLLPGWIPEFRQAIVAYRQYNGGALSILQTLTSSLWGNVLAFLVLLATARLCWRVRYAEPASAAFRWITALVLAVTVIVMPKTSPYNQVLLLPGILLIAQRWRVAWAKGSLARLILILTVVIVFWPWLVAFAITTVVALFPTMDLTNLWIAPAYTLLAIPFGISAVLAFHLRIVGGFEIDRTCTSISLS